MSFLMPSSHLFFRLPNGRVNIGFQTRPNSKETNTERNSGTPHP